MKMTMWWAMLILSAAVAGAQATASGGESGSTAVQTGETSASAAQATNVSAELTKKVDSKHSKVGDEVTARTTSEARLADGTRLPKGSKLVGKVTDVEAKSKQNHDARLAFAFDHAVLKDGREVPVEAMTRSIAAPAQVAAAGSDDMMADGGAAGGGMGGAMVRGGGGAVGGGGAGRGMGVSNAATGTLRGATGAAGSAGGGAAGDVNDAASGIDGTARGAVGAAGNVAANGTAGVNGAMGAGAAIPVRNLSGVTFSVVNGSATAGAGGATASGDTMTATMLTGHGRDVTLESGSQLTMSVSPR
jgi:hypothetical protein